MDVASILRALGEALARILPSLAAYFAGKSGAQAASGKKALEDALRAKALADNLTDADVKRLRRKWTR